MPSHQQPTNDDAVFNLDSLKKDDADRAFERQIGTNLRALRQRKGLSQTALGEAMAERGMTAWRQTTVSRVEQGTRSLYVDELEALEQILGGGLWASTKLAQGVQMIAVAGLQTQMRSRLRKLREEVDELEEMLDVLARLAAKAVRANGLHDFAAEAGGEVVSVEEGDDGRSAQR